MSKKINRITPLNEISNMAGLTVTTALTDLKVLFNDLKEVYFNQDLGFGFRSPHHGHGASGIG